ncbi:MAG: hypothetical protein WC310_05020 [Patescibacteria group bacterium]|jgi:hypothetical protein
MEVPVWEEEKIGSLRKSYDSQEAEEILKAADFVVAPTINLFHQENLVWDNKVFSEERLAAGMDSAADEVLLATPFFGLEKGTKKDGQCLVAYVKVFETGVLILLKPNSSIQKQINKIENFGLHAKELIVDKIDVRGSNQTIKRIKVSL